ncbi:hypothetical protein P8825_14310 [Shouchella clausii]|nr:hypothetical protein [Shouchella clausii]MEB5480737.1 hypothetical protein [Shouchella clausii]
MTEETATIAKKEYERLLKDSEFLSFLGICGVENWTGFEQAVEMMEKESE